MTQYYWRGYAVVVKQMFSSCVNIIDPHTGKIRQVALGELNETIPTPEALIQPTNVLAFKGEEQNLLVVRDTANSFATGTKEDERDIKTEVHINSLSLRDVTKLTKAFSGLGRVTAKAMITNRPASGYESLEHLQKVLEGHIGQTIRWDLLAPQLNFTLSIEEPTQTND